MIPISLRLKNFYLYKDETLDFTDLDVALIIGETFGNRSLSNGTGKSALAVESITWCLFEKFRGSENKSIDKNKIIKRGETEAEVEFVFKLGKFIYRVVRTRNIKTAFVNFEVQKDGKWIAVADTEEKTKRTNDIIQETLGVTYEVFVNSIVFEQGSVSTFAEAQPSDRRQIVSDILRINRYDTFADKAKEKHRVLKDKEIELRAQVEDEEKLKNSIEENERELKQTEKSQVIYTKEIDKLNKELSELRLEKESCLVEVAEGKSLKIKLQSVKQQIDKLEETLKKLEKDISAYRAKLDTEKQKYREVKASLEETQEKLKAKPPVTNLADLKAKQEELDKQLKKIQNEVNTIRIEGKTQKNKVDDKKNEIVQLDEVNLGECPTCFSDVTEEGKENIKKKKEAVLKTEDAKLKVLIDKYKEVKAKEDSISNELTELNAEVYEKEAALFTFEQQQKDNLKEQEKLEERLERIKGTGKEYKQNIEKLEESKKDNEKELEEKKEEFEELKKEYSKSKRIDDTKVDQLTQQVNAIEDKLKTTTEALQNLNLTIKVLERDIEQDKTKIEKSKKISKELIEVIKEITEYAELILAFGKKGVQALILENCVSEIEKEANNLLLRLTNGNMSISIATQRETKKGEKTEAFDIIVQDNYQEDYFDMFSGGEKLRISLAIRVALAKLLARRSGTQLRFLVFDEATHFLDEDGIEKFIEVVNLLKQDFDVILVITHQPELKQYFDNILVVSKQKDGSVIKRD